MVEFLGSRSELIDDVLQSFLRFRVVCVRDIVRVDDYRYMWE